MRPALSAVRWHGMTQDCPTGVRALRRRMAVAATSVCALFLAVGVFASRIGRPREHDQSSVWERMKSRAHQVEPFKSFLGWLDSEQSQPGAQNQVVYSTMGDCVAFSRNWAAAIKPNPSRNSKKGP